MYPLIRQLLFALEPEKAHHLSMTALNTLYRLPGGGNVLRSLYNVTEYKPLHWKGLYFRHPIGLAAGFDKDGEYTGPLSALGFSYIEVGTVTPRPQPGNERPRLFRLPADKALINRMGFNNKGVHALKSRLQHIRPSGLIIGGNIGKNKDTPNEEAILDYLTCFEILHPVVDYFTINVSSPNTPGLRALQDKKPLENIISQLKNHPLQSRQYRPILIKIAPDLTDGQLDDIVEVCAHTGLDGIVATNTTIGRSGLKTSQSKIEKIGLGGLSGRPVRSASDSVLSRLSKTMGQDTLLIGVGGIFTADDVRRKLDLGAHLVQVYTGFVYQGPSMVHQLIKNLQKA